LEGEEVGGVQAIRGEGGYVGGVEKATVDLASA
jgi:hypothetical protein